MKYILLLVFLTGCTPVIVRQQFPTVPSELLEAPAQLKTVPDGAQADQVFETVIDNYGTYHQLSDKYRRWQEWYINQKKIYDEK